MGIERRRSGILRLWHVTAAALLLCAAAGIAFDLFAYFGSSGVLPARARSSIALVGSPLVHAQVRVRPSSWQHIGQPVLPHASLHAPAQPRCADPVPSPAAPVTTRQRLAELTILRI